MCQVSTSIEKNLSRADKDCYISILNIIQGEVDPTQVCFNTISSLESLIIVVSGAQESSKDQRKKAGKLHPMGTCIYSGWLFMAFH